MNPQFDSPEDVDREYARRIENEPDPGRKAELRVAAAEAKLELQRHATNQRMVAAWKQLAIMEYPHAAKFAEMVVGNTEEELRQSAETVHKRVEEMVSGNSDSFDQVRQQAQDFYGRGPTTGTTGGAGNAPLGYTAPNMAEERWNREFAERFNNAPRDLYGQRLGISPSDVTRYTNNRFISQVKDRIRFWGAMTRSSG